jgi:hypothetical protein
MFSVNVNDVPCLSSYRQAKIHHDSIKPIRGRTLRPIGDRRKQHMTIEETQHEGVNGIACVLYNTKVVTYFEDGRIRLDSGGYCTQSTVKFMDRLIPMGHVRIGQRGHHLRWHVGGNVYKIAGNYNHELWLDAEFKPINPEPFVVHEVNRAAMKAIRAQYAPFLTYAVGIGKLMGWTPSEKTVAAYMPHLQEHILSGDLDDWAPAVEFLLRHCGRWVAGWDPSGSYGRAWECSEAAVRNKLTTMIKRWHAREIFTEVALPIGQFKLDSNIKYIY